MILLSLNRNNRIREEYRIMDIIDQLYNSHVSAATLDALDKYRIHKDQALHGYHALKEQLTDDQAAALEQIMDENLMGTYKIYLKKANNKKCKNLAIIKNVFKISPQK